MVEVEPAAEVAVSHLLHSLMLPEPIVWLFFKPLEVKAVEPVTGVACVFPYVLL